MCGEQICEKIFDKFIANLFLKNGNYPLLYLLAVATVVSLGIRNVI